MVNGTFVAEGQMFDLRDDEIPKTTDVVFIVEAKSCNHNLTGSKNFENVIGTLEKAFGEVGLSDIR